jgi:phosphoglycerate dehydrogenase-like enzyme
MTSAGQVVVTYPGFDSTDPSTAGVLRDAGFEVRLEPRLRERTTLEVMEMMSEATAGLISTDPFDASVFAGCPDLRVLARVGVGTDAIDLAAATEAGVAVTTTPGVNAETVADHTLALMLACCRRLSENDAMIRAGRWDRGGSLIGIDLAGLTVGIIGLGTIGTAVARRLAGFDVNVIGFDAASVMYAGVTLVELADLLRTADVITVHVPLLPSTKGLIGPAELAAVRPGTILVNTSRGGVVDEQAVIEALRDGRLASAGLDVFAAEPPVASPLLDMPNVVLSPHAAGISVAAQSTMLQMATRSIIEVLGGRAVEGLVNPAVLDQLIDGRVARA